MPYHGVFPEIPPIPPELAFPTKDGLITLLTFHDFMTSFNKPTSRELLGPKRHSRERPSKSSPRNTRRGTSMP